MACHETRPETLATEAQDDLDGVLSGRDGFGCYPKIDHATGELWNVGVRQGRRPALLVVEKPIGEPARLFARIPLSNAPMAADLAVAGRHVVVSVPPLVLPRLPARLLLGRRSYRDSLRWRPELGARFVAIDRDSGRRTWWTTGPTEPVMIQSLSHAVEEGDDIVVQASTYPDASFLRASAEVMAGELHTQAVSMVEEIRKTYAATVGVQDLNLEDIFLELHHAA